MRQQELQPALGTCTMLCRHSCRVQVHSGCVSGGVGTIVIWFSVADEK